MDSIKEKLAEWRKDQRLVRIAAILGGAMLILIALACISIGMRSNIQKRYSQARAQIQEQIYQEMIEMADLFSRVDDPNVDVQNKLIPSLRAEYAAVTALNTALIEGFGAQSAVLSQEQTEAFEAAFNEYASAYRQGRATGLARDDMAACIAGVQSMIDERYASEVEEEEPVLVIGATAVPKE